MNADDMTPAQLSEFLEERKKALKISFAEMERQAKVRPGSIYNLRKGVKNGTHTLRHKTAQALLLQFGSGNDDGLGILLAEEAALEEQLKAIRHSIQLIRTRRTGV